MTDQNMILLDANPNGVYEYDTIIRSTEECTKILSLDNVTFEVITLEKKVSIYDYILINKKTHYE